MSLRRNCALNLRLKFSFSFRNQELLEKLKNGIAEQVKREQDNARAADHSKNVLDSIRSTIIDLILKLQEIDESLDPENTFRHLEKLTDQMLESTTNERLLQSLEDKLRRGLMATGQLVMREDDSGRETDDYEAIESVETANSRAIDNDDPLDLTLKVISIFPFALFTLYFHVSSILLFSWTNCMCRRRRISHRDHNQPSVKRIDHRSSPMKKNDRLHFRRVMRIF